MTDQGSEYADFVKGELADEEARRSSVNTRAFTSITASGTQFAVATGLLLFLRGKDWLPRHGAAWAFAVSLSLYLISVGLGLLATQSHKTTVASPETMRTMLTERWMDHQIDARNSVAAVRVNAIEALREGTGSKTKWLKRSVWAQIAAMTALAVAVVQSTV